MTQDPTYFLEPLAARPTKRIWDKGQRLIFFFDDLPVEGSVIIGRQL